MNVYEYFSRCPQCNSALIKKEEFIVAAYQHDRAGKRVIQFTELPEQRETRYTCAECNVHIYTSRE